jgi:DNA-binding LytR/AlgR family response regulator
MLRCFIADDEAPARQRLRRLLAQLGTASVVGEAADGVSTLEQLTECQPDVLLLDIGLPELDGLAVAAALAASATAPAIVFVTAHDEHALAAFELSAFDYLVKPVHAERLAAALAKVETRSRRLPAEGELAALLVQLRSSRPGRRMAARSGARFIVFDPARVYGIFARDHYSLVLLDGEELLLDDPLDQLQRRLDPEQFLRIHRSAIVNLARLRQLEHEGDRRYVAVLADAQATRVPVSRERLPALRAALGL